jgi:hypothetical protein
MDEMLEEVSDGYTDVKSYLKKFQLWAISFWSCGATKALSVA